MEDIKEIITMAIGNIQRLKDLEISSVDSGLALISDQLDAELKEIQEKVLYLINENMEQKKEIKELKIRLGEENGFDLKNNVYYTPDGDGPFCPYCYDKRSRKNRLRSDISEKDSSVIYACRVCGGSFGS